MRGGEGGKKKPSVSFGDGEGTRSPGGHALEKSLPSPKKRALYFSSEGTMAHLLWGCRTVHALGLDMECELLTTLDIGDPHSTTALASKATFHQCCTRAVDTAVSVSYRAEPPTCPRVRLSIPNTSTTIDDEDWLGPGLCLHAVGSSFPKQGEASRTNY